MVSEHYMSQEGNGLMTIKNGLMSNQIKSSQIKSNLFAISKVCNITVDKKYISLGWTDRQQLRTYVCP